MKLSLERPQYPLVSHIDLEAVARRVGHTPEIRARWLLDFCKTNFTRLDDTSCVHLGLEAVIFCRKTPAIQKLSDGQLHFIIPLRPILLEWHLRMRNRLRRLAIGKPWCLQMRADRQLSVGKDGRLSRTVEFKHFHRPAGFPFSEEAMEIIDAVRDRFRFCANNSCRLAFLRTNRQIYCSARCQGAVMKRNYRLRRGQGQSVASREPATPYKYPLVVFAKLKGWNMANVETHLRGASKTRLLKRIS